jgi:hypothetical protein
LPSFAEQKRLLQAKAAKVSLNECPSHQAQGHAVDAKLRQEAHQLLPFHLHNIMAEAPLSIISSMLD